MRKHPIRRSVSDLQKHTRARTRSLSLSHTHNHTHAHTDQRHDRAPKNPLCVKKRLWIRGSFFLQVKWSWTRRCPVTRSHTRDEESLSKCPSGARLQQSESTRPINNWVRSGIKRTLVPLVECVIDRTYRSARLQCAYCRSASCRQTHSGIPRGEAQLSLTQPRIKRFTV